MVWDFELAHCAKTRKSQAADRTGLEFYFVLLQIILKHAPFGHPNIAHLKIVWKTLQEKYQVMSKAAVAEYGTNVLIWASACAEKVRLACAHAVKLEQAGTEYVAEKVKALMDLVTLRNEGASLSSAASSSSAAPILQQLITIMYPVKAFLTQAIFVRLLHRSTTAF